MRKLSDDSEFNDTLKKLDSDLRWSKNRKDIVKNRIFMDIEQLEYPVKNKKSSAYIMRNTLYGVCTLIILLGLFIGSAFFSPSMAEVASKIPYLNQLFHSVPINKVIWENLEEKGYQIAGISRDGKGMVIYIEGSEQYFEDVKEEVKETAQKIINGKGYDNDAVKVERQIDKVVQISQRDEEISEAVQGGIEQLANENSTILTHGFSYPSPDSENIIIHIDVPDKETRINEIKDVMTEILNDRGIEKYTIEINRINLQKQEKEAQWGELFPVIYEGLSSKKEYQVTGFAYSFDPAPLQIIIKTSIHVSDREADAKVRLIEETIEEFLESKEIQQKIGGDPYIIIIRDKEQNKIN